MSEDYAATIDGIYDAAIANDGWSELLCDIADRCGLENAALVVHDPHANFSSVLTPRADPAVIRDYGEYWWQHDLTAQATANAPVGKITSLHDTGRDRFLNSSFYNDFWCRSGLGAERLASNLLAKDGAFASIVLHASHRRDEIDDQSLRAFAILAPHLVRAISISSRLQRLEIENAAGLVRAGSKGTGVIVVDAKMRLIHADTTGEDLLQAGTAIGLAGNRVVLKDTASAFKLAGMVEACGTRALGNGGKVSIGRGGMRKPVQIEVLPFRVHAGLLQATSPVAMLLVNDPERDQQANVERLRRQFGLTRAEAALALEMMAGDGRAAAAARCGISVNTARTHLTRVFEKTGVNRQAELIRVLMASATPGLEDDSQL